MSNTDNKPKVLIVEDDKFIISAFELSLKNAGFEVITANNGEEALEKIKQTRPNVILLDLIIPKKSGLEVLEEIKADEKLKNIPTLVVSNIELKPDQDVKALGAADFFIKSNLSIDSLVEKIKTYIK